MMMYVPPLARKASGVLDGQTYARIECGQPECTYTS
jgi:hypothetical protein